MARPLPQRITHNVSIEVSPDKKRDETVPRAFNLGSITMDMVIQLERFPEAGETANGLIAIELIRDDDMEPSQ